MEFIKKIQHRLHDRMIRRQLGDYEIQRSSIAYDDAHQFGILFDATELSERKAVLAFADKLKKKKKKVRLLGYLNGKERQVNLPFDHIANQDLNWIGKINADFVDEFVAAKFDWLVCIHQAQPLLDISMRSLAALRVGPALENTNAFDLMIEKKNLKADKFIEQIEFFCKKIGVQQ